MISKELLSEVLGGNVKYFNIDGNLLYYDIDFGTHINIYELAHKCKEWTLKKGFSIHSFITEVSGESEIYKYVKNYGWRLIQIENDSTEPEAIFKACEWIYAQLKKETS